MPLFNRRITMASLNFLKKRVTDFKLVKGTDSYTVDCDFTPNAVLVDFVDILTKNEKDTISWDLAATATGYQLTVSHVTASPRKIKVVLAKYAKNPEQTISFGS